MVHGGTDRHRRDALVRRIASVTTVEKVHPHVIPLRLMQSAARRLGYRIDFARENRRLFHIATSEQPDLIWFNKPLTIRRSTLRRIRTSCPSTRLVAYSGDDFFYPPTTSRHLLSSLDQYDLVVTTKRNSVPRIRQQGAIDALFVDNAVEPTVHRPAHAVDSPERQIAVSYIGRYERQRARYIEALNAAGIPVSVWGPIQWSHLAKRAELLNYGGRFLADGAYADVLSRSKIGLGFLSAAVGDLQTTRSVEIPACGAMLLAQRTDEHRRLFRENEEAVFFSNEDELVESAHGLLGDDPLRCRIAAAGLARASRYTNDRMITIVLDHLYAAAT
jgi:hypothetical protein